VQENKPTHGFSAFQFLPFREHEVVALKSEEHHDDIHTCTLAFLQLLLSLHSITSYLHMRSVDLMVFDLAGQVLLEETLVGNVKYVSLRLVFWIRLIFHSPQGLRALKSSKHLVPLQASSYFSDLLSQKKK